jgi:trk system potassium uptake protein TrkA
VGGQAAHALCYRGNDVTVIDADESALDRLREESDVMTLHGNAALPSVLSEAGVQSADMVLALTGNSEANLVICALAKTFGVQTKVGRLRTRRYFDPDLDVGRELFGVDDFIIPEEACVQEIMDSLNRPAVKESVPIGPKACEMVNFQVPQGSPLAGIQLQHVPRPELLERLRVCAVKRYGRLIVPRGDTEVSAYDEAYVAGNRRDLDAFITWATPEARPIRRVLVTGATSVARRLATAVEAAGMTLSMVVSAEADGHSMIEELSAKTTLICGESTDASVLEEAAVGEADAVVAAGANNEANILTCILAKRMGAGKVVSVVDNTDYSQIIANLTMIDCGFNPLVAAVDSLLQHIGSEVRQHVAVLKRIDAEVLDLVVKPSAGIAGKRIADIAGPADMVFIAIFRAGDFVPPVGRETLCAGDRVTVLARRNCHEAVERLFAGKRLF